jgi:hypothetical protein
MPQQKRHAQPNCDGRHQIPGDEGGEDRGAGREQIGIEPLAAVPPYNKRAVLGVDDITAPAT